MIFTTNKEKGNSSLGIAIAYYSSNGYTVSIPLNDTQDYDLIVDKEIVCFIRKFGDVCDTNERNKKQININYM